MQFSFDECGFDKSVNVFDLTCDGVENFKSIEVKGPRKLIRLTADGVEAGVNLLRQNSEKFVELTLILDAPMTPSESAKLHECENLVSLKADVKDIQSLNERVSNKNKSASELFSDYYKSRYDAQVPSDLLALFLSLTEEE